MLQSQMCSFYPKHPNKPANIIPVASVALIKTVYAGPATYITTYNSEVPAVLPMDTQMIISHNN